MVLAEKGLLEKAVTFKIFEYWLLGSDLKKQTENAKKQYEKLERDKTRVISLIKRKTMKQKRFIKQKRKGVLSEMYTTVVNLLFKIPWY